MNAEQATTDTAATTHGSPGATIRAIDSRGRCAAVKTGPSVSR